MQLPLGELAKHDGFEVTFAAAGDYAGDQVRITAKELQGYDVIVAQRWNKHEGLGVWRRARTPASRLVYDLDDDVFSITPENFAAYTLYGRGDIQDATAHAAGTADLVTVSTEPLAQVMREVITEAGNPEPNVAVLPNHVPAWVLDLPRVQRDRPRIGWQGGASHGLDIGVVAEPARRFLKRFPGWDLQLCGTDYRVTFRADKDRMHYCPWIQVNRDPEAYYRSIDYDIGLAPLVPTTFARSKSGLKAIEHGARGIPTIATDCEAYRAVITHGVDGFLVRQDHEWLKYMSELAGDDDLRAKMGEAARDMTRRYLIENGWTLWRDAYRKLFPG